MATTDMQRLVVSLEARTKAFENAMNKALGIANKRGRAIESQFMKMNKNIAGRMVGIGKGMVAGIIAGIGTRELQQLSDAGTRITNALKVAGLSGAELETVYGKLRDSAMANAAPLETLVGLYGRLSLVQKELGVSQAQLYGFTDKIAVALRVAGGDAQSASGALLQLSQALGGGTVRAEEFNSIQEGALPILQAVAAGMKEAGGSVSKLRQLVIDGKISSQAFFRAFEAGAPILDQRVAGATFTIGQSIINLNSAMIDAALEFNNATGAGGGFARGIDNVARAIKDFDVAGFIRKLQDTSGAIEKFMQDAGNSGFFMWLAETLTGKELTIGKPIDLETVEAEKKVASLQREIELLKQQIENSKEMKVDTTEAESRLASLLRQVGAVQMAVTNASTSVRPYVPGTPGDPNAMAEQWGKTAKPIPKIKQISYKDYAAAGSGKKGKRDRDDDYERETKQIIERAAAIQAETAAQAALNPLIDDYGYAVEKARTEQDLLNAAKEAGKTVTPALRAEIEQLAHWYATSAAEAERLAESQDHIREAADFAKGMMLDTVNGLRDALADGKLEWKELADIAIQALNKITDKLLNEVLDALFKVEDAAGGSGGGWLSWLFKGLGSFGGGGGFSIPGRAAGGPVRKGQPYIVGEKRRELFVPDQSGRILPSVPSSTRTQAGSGGDGNLQVVINNAPPGTAAREEKSGGADKRQLRRLVVEVMNENLATGGADKSMKRFGAQPTKVRR